MDTNVEFKDMESSTSGDSDKGPCTEAPQIGATGRDPAEQRVGETPLIWGGNTHVLTTECLEKFIVTAYTIFLCYVGNDN